MRCRFSAFASGGNDVAVFAVERMVGVFDLGDDAGHFAGGDTDGDGEFFHGGKAAAFGEMGV